MLERSTVYEKPTDIPHPTGADLVRYAAEFVSVPYLWGGRAGFGLDCSGFTSTVYQLHGITLPRDAGPQAADSRGRAIDKSALQPGDLLFYSHGEQAIPTIPTRSTTWPCIRKRPDDRGIRQDGTGAHHPGSTGRGLLGRAPLPRLAAVSGVDNRPELSL